VTVGILATDRIVVSQIDVDYHSGRFAFGSERDHPHQLVVRSQKRPPPFIIGFVIDVDKKKRDIVDTWRYESLHEAHMKVGAHVFVFIEHAMFVGSIDYGKHY